MNALTDYKNKTVKETLNGRITIRCVFGRWITSSRCNSKVEKAAQGLYLENKKTANVN